MDLSVAYRQSRQEMKRLATRMKLGTGVGNIISNQTSSTHYIDALQRFEKDYSVYDHHKRQLQKLQRQKQLRRKRVQLLERQNKKFIVSEELQQRKERRLKTHWDQVQRGRKKILTSNGLPYNPINLSYDNNSEGNKLRLNDEDHQIRNYIRAKNIEKHGNSVYNPLNGHVRGGIQKAIPNNLHERYCYRLKQFESKREIKLPQTSNDNRKSFQV